MAPTRPLNATVQVRAQKDAVFRAALLAEGAEALLAGDIETGTKLLRLLPR